MNDHSRSDFLRRYYRSIEGSRLAVRLRSSLVSRYNKLVHPTLFGSVRCFCLFIGHGRSGSTLVGAMLNAHKNVVLSNELNALQWLQDGLSRDQLFNHIRSTSKSQARHGSSGGGGYYYAVPNQWQGRHERIDVIGDRKAGTVAIQLYRDPSLFTRLQDEVGVPLKFVCVVRNPFDVITTTFKKTARHLNERPESHLRRQVERYFMRCQAIERLSSELGSENVHFVRHEALVQDTQSELARLCRFFDLEPSASYLADCASIVQRKPNVTRRSVDWSADLIEEVQDQVSRVPWLTSYEFGSAP